MCWRFADASAGELGTVQVGSFSRAEQEEHLWTGTWCWRHWLLIISLSCQCRRFLTVTLFIAVFLSVRFTCENKSGWFGFYWLSCIFHKAPLWICRHRTSYCRQMTRTSLVASSSHRTAPVTRCVVPDNHLLHIPIAGFVGACLGFMINLFFIFSCIIFILTGFACGIGVISWIVQLIHVIMLSILL